MTKCAWRLAALGILLLLLDGPASAQQETPQNEFAKLPWQAPPATGQIGGVAQIGLANDLRFLDADGTSRFLKLTDNPSRDNEFTLAPATLAWFAIFTFDKSGYVKDDERIDPDELLAVLKKQNESSIEERRRLRLPILHLEGWAVEPHYDSETHRLEWGTRFSQDKGEITVNYTVRILGRSGVMSAILVSSPETLDADKREFKTALRGFAFKTGETYAEFRQGDRVAQYGLAALIVGGAAAVATSSGLMKGLGKLVAFGALGAFAAVGAFFKRLFRRKPREQ
jgi:uncharacterized membrane-anchored protein